MSNHLRVSQRPICHKIRLPSRAFLSVSRWPITIMRARQRSKTSAIALFVDRRFQTGGCIHYLKFLANLLFAGSGRGIWRISSLHVRVGGACIKALSSSLFMGKKVYFGRVHWIAWFLIIGWDLKYILNLQNWYVLYIDQINSIKSVIKPLLESSEMLIFVFSFKSLDCIYTNRLKFYILSIQTFRKLSIPRYTFFWVIYELSAWIINPAYWSKSS